jgi:hypothetical protein
MCLIFQNPGIHRADVMRINLRFPGIVRVVFMEEMKR